MTTHAQLQPPKLDAGQKEALSRLLEVIDEEKQGVSVNTVCTMLKISQPHALALIRQLEAGGHVKMIAGRAVAHPQSITKNFSAPAPFVNPFADEPTATFGRAAKELAASPMISGMLNALPRTERQGCLGILDVVLAHPKEGVPKGTFARAMSEEKVAQLLTDLQFAGAIRIREERVFPGTNLASVINNAANVKGG